MKKNGFTLVEILGVIVLLSLLILIAIPSINNALQASKNSISNIEKKNIEEASKIVVLEVVNCDISTTDFNYLFNKSTSDCLDMQDIVVGKTISTTIEKLKAKNYYKDISNKCSGTVSITTYSNYKVTVTTNNVTCSN